MEILGFLLAPAEISCGKRAHALPVLLKQFPDRPALEVMLIIHSVCVGKGKHHIPVESLEASMYCQKRYETVTTESTHGVLHRPFLLSCVRVCERRFKSVMQPEPGESLMFLQFVLYPFTYSRGICVAATSFIVKLKSLLSRYELSLLWIMQSLSAISLWL